MPNWRKVVVSGSDAALNSLFVSNAVTASRFSGSFTGSLFGTASWALNVVGGSAGAITIADEGTAQGTATFLNFTGNAVTATVSANTASINIAAAQGTGSVTLHTQPSPAVTWSFNHKLNNTYPVLNVWDSNGFTVIPGGIKSVDANNVEIYFDVAQSGYASAVVGGTAISASVSVSSSYALTASYALNTAGTTSDFPYTGSAIISGSLTLIQSGSRGLTVTGSVVSTGGFTGSLFGTASYVTGSIFSSTNPALSSSYALTSSFALSASWSPSVFPFTGSAIISGSLLVTGSANISSSIIVNSTILSTQQNADVDIGTEVVATVFTGSYKAAFFDYYANDGVNYRAGTVMSTWNTASSVVYSDNSTLDIGNTSGVTLAVVPNGNVVELRATVTTNNWDIKAFVRAI